jgi:hypothetical protein
MRSGARQMEKGGGRAGGPGARMPCGTGRAWGLASTGGRRPDCVPADRGPAVACFISSRNEGRRVTDARDLVDSGRGREEREERDMRGPTRERPRWAEPG